MVYFRGGKIKRSGFNRSFTPHKIEKRLSGPSGSDSRFLF